MDQIDFTFGAIDGSVVRAHKAAAGAKKTGSSGILAGTLTKGRIRNRD